MSLPTNSQTSGANVGYKRKELRDMEVQYTLISDCIAGEVAVKGAKDKYLPRPDPSNTTPDNTARYDAYVVRAVFYNATSRTLRGLLGEVFAVDPIVELPAVLEPVKADASGSGVTLNQQATALVHNVLAFSRAGVFVDYPALSEPATQAQVDSGALHPIIKVYEPVEIINWRTIVRGSRTILSLVVIEEWIDKTDDGFETTQEKQWRVLRLDAEGLYRVEIWKSNITSTTSSQVQSIVSGVGSPSDVFQPKDASGKRFEEIPFMFVGAIDNDVLIEQPLFYDLASLNIAHYRNSADFEESSFVVGQPTYVFTGLTKDWVDNVLKGVVKTGSRTAVPLPVNATAAILQPDPNTLPGEGMDKKERQMVALGAKLVENQTVQRTATETTMDQRTENSILSTAANNSSAAMLWALQWCAKWLGLPITGIQFQINTDFAVARLSPEDQQQLVSTWQAGGITIEEMRAGLRKSGIATEPDTTAMGKLKKEADERDARETKKQTTIATAKAKATPVGTSRAVQPKSRTPKKKAA